MLKFIFYTDTHYTDKPPRNRCDNILESQFAELGELLKFAHEQDVDFLIHGGDFFDTRKPGYMLIVHLLSWFKQLYRPVYSVLGNHDLYGYNLESINNSGLGILLGIGAVEKLDELIFEKDKTIIKGFHCALDLDKSYQFDSKYDAYTKIGISHNYILPSETLPFEFKHPRDIKTNGNLFLCGHYHIPYDYSTEHARWINPGAISRWKITERDHTPQVLLITIQNGTINVSYHKLKTSKLGHEIFDVEAIAVQKHQEQNIEQFAKSLEATSFQDVDIEQVVQTVGREQKIDQFILDIILKKLKEAKEILK